MPYPVRRIPFNTRDYADYRSLQRIRAFDPNADAQIRQMTIDYVVEGHAFSKKHTKSLRYNGALGLPGRNVAGVVEIGPAAFKQNQEWLAGIVFHELVHSPQYAYYAARGLTKIDPDRSDTERLMIALDEYEAYWWSLKRAEELGLSEEQQKEIRKRAQFALIDLDDSKIQGFAQSRQFNAGRDELLRRHNPKPAPVKTAMMPRKACYCYA